MTQFNAEIWKAGNSFVLTIPKDFMDNGELQTGKKYHVIVEEGDKDGIN